MVLRLGQAGYCQGMGLARPRIALEVLCAASFLAVVDTTIVSIALPSIMRSMEFSASGSQWVLNAYALVFGGLLLLFSRLGDRVGRRRVFVIGLLLFVVGSVLAGIATQPWMLLGGRIVQGLGAAAFVPSSLSLLTANFAAGETRSRALAAYGAMAGLGFVVGMVGGGVITALLGWRWIFLLNVPIVLIMLLPVHRVLPESRDTNSPRSLDVGGAVVVTIGLISLIFAMTSAPRDGWLAPTTWGAALIGIAAAILFVVIERHHPAPLVPPAAVAKSPVLVPNGAILLQSMVGVAWLYLLTFYFQDLRGMGPLISGLWFAPMTVASVIGAIIAGRATVRIGNRTTAMVGLVLMAAGLIVLALAVGIWESFDLAIVGTVVGETGFTLGSVALTIMATSSLGDHHAGLGSGLVNTSNQLGGGFGLGVVAAVVAATAAQSGIDATALTLGFLTCLAFVLSALVLVAIGSGRALHTQPDSGQVSRPLVKAREAPRSRTS
jgi:EmrB/QacA subfamily drug resistance transporter